MNLVNYVVEGNISRSARRVPRYLLVGVDVYRTPECADEDKARIDRSRPYLFTNNATFFCVDATTYFHSGRFYELIDLRLGERITYSNLMKLREELRRKRIRRINVLRRPVVESANINALYVKTPLDELADKLQDA